MKVLILASPDDGHGQVVATALAKIGAHVDFFSFSEFIEQCSLSFQIGGKDKLTRIKRAQETLDLRSYTSIWHRRPGLFKPGRFVESWISEMVQRETISAVGGILRTVPCLWVNDPISDVAATSKLWQLEIATEVGLTIPETLVTNSPEKVREFFEYCDGQVIHKLISDQTAFAIPPAEVPAGIATLPLRKQDLEHIDQVRHAPHLFQRNVAKAFELRVTIVGNKIFSIKIDSQIGRAKLDWRNDYSVPMSAYDLPEDIESKCLALMQRLHLNYGAIDFIVTPDHNFVFLEINPSGQYIWIEERTDVQITPQMALLLAGQAEPLVPARTVRS